MLSSVLMKNGNINLPAKIRKSLNLKPGDRIQFIRTMAGYRIVPIVDIFDLIDEKNKDLTIELIEEIHEERKKMAEE